MFLKKAVVRRCVLIVAAVALPALAQQASVEKNDGGANSQPAPTPVVQNDGGNNNQPAPMSGDATGGGAAVGGNQPPAPQNAGGGNNNQFEDYTADEQPSGGLFGGNFMFIMIGMFAIMYFFMIRPEQKKQKARQAMLSKLNKGAKIVTIGGIIGTITAIKENSYVIKSGEGTILEFTKSAVSNILSGDDGASDVGAKESK